LAFNELSTTSTMTNDGSGDNDGILQKQDDPIEKETQEQHHAPKYSAKKPNWWLRLTPRRGTKAQRRIMAAMKHYMIPSPRYGELVEWNQIFSSSQCEEVWLELGFGLGDNLLRNAEMHPDTAMVGAELHSPGVANVLKNIQQSQEQGRYRDEYSLYTHEEEDTAHVAAASAPSTTGENIYFNVRVYPGNGIKLLNAIPTSSLRTILVTFPDPFPQERHAEFRLLQVSTAADFYRVLRSEGRLYLATDHEGHFEWCLKVMAQCQDLYVPVSPVPDRSSWLPVISKYEQKGLEEGRHTQLACWQVVGKK